MRCLAMQALVALLVLLSALSATKKQQVLASGVFEIQFQALQDAGGRDLREDCCQWQQEPDCDSSKCQLILRVCVTNYQAQAEPGQCTFGELSAQVSRPNEPARFAHYPLRPALRQQDSSAVAKPASPLTGRANIHHQRMLFQQRQQQLPLNQQQQQQFQLVSSGQPLHRRSIAFDQPVAFPFNFTWPGSFALSIDAWYEAPTLGFQQHRLLAAAPATPLSHHLATPPARDTTYDLYRKQLIIRHAMHGWLPVRDEWTSDARRSKDASLTYSYRVTCQPNYFGPQCNVLCRPRDDVYGHYTCSDRGAVQCLPGWRGAYCLEPVCAPGCHQEQGWCSRPNECQCRPGFRGPQCRECAPYPGCEHGTCQRPHECVCKPGWGGLLCDENLNVCANHRPCQNDAVCANVFNEQGIGSYNCTCQPGFAGTNCELRLDQASAQQPAGSPTNSDQQQQQQQQPSGQRSRQGKAGDTAPAPRPRPLPMWQTVDAADSSARREPLLWMVSLLALSLLVLGLLLLNRRRQNRSPRGRGALEAEASLQNQRNLYRSRSSLVTNDKVPFATDSPVGTLSSSASSSAYAGWARPPPPPPPPHDDDLMASSLGVDLPPADVQLEAEYQRDCRLSRGRLDSLAEALGLERNHVRRFFESRRAGGRRGVLDAAAAAEARSMGTGVAYGHAHLHHAHHHRSMHSLREPANLPPPPPPYALSQQQQHQHQQHQQQQPPAYLNLGHAHLGYAAPAYGSLYASQHQLAAAAAANPYGQHTPYYVICHLPGQQPAASSQQQQRRQDRRQDRQPAAAAANKKGLDV